MHTPDWRQSLGELCRVARDRVVFDYPALSSAAALQAVGAPRRARGRRAPSRPIASSRDRAVRAALAGQRLPRRRQHTASSCCRSPCTSGSIRRPRRRRIEGAARRAPACGGCSGRRSPSWRSVAGPSHRRHRLHRRAPRARAGRAAAMTCARSCATPSRAGRSGRGPAFELGRRRPRGSRIARSRGRRRRRRLSHRRDLPAGRPARREVSRGQRYCGADGDRGGARSRRAPRRPLQHRRRARRRRASAGRTRTRRSGPATSTRRRRSKGKRSRATRRRQPASRS